MPEERVEAFVAGARAAVAAMYPRLADNPDYTSIIDERHRERLAGYLDEARARGERVEVLNPAAEDLAGSPKMAPALVVRPDPGSRLMREEIFGPILPVVAYRTLDEAIAFVNARPTAARALRLRPRPRARSIACSRRPSPAASA